MQFNFVALALSALVATAAAQNATNGTNGTAPSVPTGAPESGAFHTAVSGGLLGAAIAGGIALVL